MNNRERAEMIASEDTALRRALMPIIDRITQALDEAEKRGVVVGFRNGQMQMRERAADRVWRDVGPSDSRFDWNQRLAHEIRALPIEGECDHKQDTHGGCICDCHKVLK